MNSSQRIEIRDVQPLVARWTLRAAMIVAWCLLAASVALLVTSVLALRHRPEVWAVMPGGQVFGVQPLLNSRRLALPSESDMAHHPSRGSR